MPPSIVAASRAVRRWRAAAVAGLAAFAVTVLAGVVLRHGSDSRPASNAAVVVPRSAAPAVPAAPVAPMRAPAARAQATRAGGADETDRPRRHRKVKPPVDEDATLPPTGTEGDL